jgi:hypothetical protein
MVLRVHSLSRFRIGYFNQSKTGWDQFQDLLNLLKVVKFVRSLKKILMVEK